MIEDASARVPTMRWRMNFDVRTATFESVGFSYHGGIFDLFANTGTFMTFGGSRTPLASQEVQLEHGDPQAIESAKKIVASPAWDRFLRASLLECCW